MHVYREEIDGLRAVAVIPVILYHAGFSRFFAGGYVGVDIFFVISGYLITSVIQAECDNQKFSLVNFYERRCRRILPALFLILFLSNIFAYYWMSFSQLDEYGHTLISILCLSSNFFFWWKDDGYFSRLSELNPLVHTWSLAVEEQFYFVFPLLCYFFSQKKFQLLCVLMYFTLTSFFLAQWGGNLNWIDHEQFQMFSQHRWATFYLPLGRIWELLLGSFTTFYLQYNKSNEDYHHKWKQCFAFLGLTFIAISILFLDNRYIQPFPNCYTLLPTCGSVLVIVFADKTTIVGSILSTKVFRGIGLISYSAYLWHQPILAFIRIHFNETPPFIYIIVGISLVLPLSAFSYFFAEQPFRQKDKFNRKQIFMSAAIASALTLILASFLIQTAHYRSTRIQEGDEYLSDLEFFSTANYTIFPHSVVHKLTDFSNDMSSTNKKLLLVGDSYSQDFYNIIREGNYLANYEIRVYYIHVYCQIYMGPEDRQTLIWSKFRQTCVNAYDIKDALYLIRRADIIIFVSAWAEWSARRLPTTIKLLNLTDQQRLIIVGSKHFSLGDKMLYANKTKEFRVAQYRPSLQSVVDTNNLMAQMFNSSMFVNVMKMICTGHNDTCPLFTQDGKLISYDTAHLTRYGAIHVGKIIFSHKPLNEL